MYGDIYARWNLSATPFAVEALKSNEKGVRLLRGRDDEIETLVNKLHREGRITCIDGQYGIGKTSLVNVATYKCLEAFGKGKTRQILLPCRTAFQLKEDLDVDEFVRKVLYHVVSTIKEHQTLLRPVCDITGFDDFARTIDAPIFRVEGLDVSNALTVGVPGVASWTSGSRGAATAAPNGSDGYIAAGFEAKVKELLDRLFTSVAGGVVCVIDNVELLETANRARRTLELLRDRLLSIRGLRWVFCGANGVIHSLASSPRLAAFLNTPVMDLKNVRTVDLKQIIVARIEEYSPDPARTLAALPFGMDQIEWLYDILNNNLRDLLSHLEQYCEHVVHTRAQIDAANRDALFKKWVKDFGQCAYIDVSKRISKNAWMVLDAAMSDDFKGSFGAGDFDKFNRNSKITVTEETFAKWLRDLKKHDILSRSIPEESTESGTDSDAELDIFTVTSKGALVFYYRQRNQENFTIATHEWLRRINV